MNRTKYDRNRKIWDWMRENLSLQMPTDSAAQLLTAQFGLEYKDALEFCGAYYLVEKTNANARTPDELRPLAEVANVELAKLRSEEWTDEEAGLNLCGWCYADTAISIASRLMGGRDVFPGAPREWTILHELMCVQPADLVKHLPVGCR